MDNHWKRKSWCEISTELYKNICKGGFSIQIIEKLPGDGYKSGIKDEDMQENWIQREDNWIKALHIALKNLKYLMTIVYKQKCFSLSQLKI